MGFALLVACSVNPLTRVPPSDSAFVTQYKARFLDQRDYLKQAVYEVVRCHDTLSGDEAANRIDVWTTGLGWYADKAPAYGPSDSPLPTCLKDANRHVTAASTPLRRGSHAVFGQSGPPASALADLSQAVAELDEAAKLLADAHC